MTHKQKAEELVAYFYVLIQEEGEDLGQEIIVSILARKCALKVVDEILSIIWHSPEDVTYWQQVKEEILKL